MTALLDANVLVALIQPGHVHAEPATTWFVQQSAFATCPVTQGALLRVLLRAGVHVRDARDALRSVVAHPAHAFWPDDLPFDQVRLDGVVGHRQVTDAYLAGLARARGARLATFDRGLAAAHPDVALLLDP